MRNRMTLLVILAFSVSVFAQKKELKTAEKSLKKLQYEEALEQLKVVEPLLAAAEDDKLQEKYYYVKAKAIYAGGENSEAYIPSGDAFQQLIDFEKEAGLKKYRDEAEETIAIIIKKLSDLGTENYKEKSFGEASKRFEAVYNLNKKDTVFLENSALAAYLNKDYDRAIEVYHDLLNMGYTGIATRYQGKSVINGEVMYYASQKDLDSQVKLGTVSDPEVTVTESRAGEIAKNIALSYIAKGDEQGALDAIAEAKKTSPKDYTLVISEANIYYKLGNNEKFLEGLKEAISIKPNDPQLYYNVGVLTLDQGYVEEAIASFQKAIELKPEYGDAYNNIGVAILKKADPIIKEMNENLSNFKKYDALMIKQKEVYKEALPYFEKALELSPKSEASLSTLINIYERLEMYDEQKVLQARLNAL